MQTYTLICRALRTTTPATISRRLGVAEWLVDLWAQGKREPSATHLRKAEQIAAKRTTRVKPIPGYPRQGGNV